MQPRVFFDNSEEGEGESVLSGLSWQLVFDSRNIEEESKKRKTPRFVFWENLIVFLKKIQSL